MSMDWPIVKIIDLASAKRNAISMGPFGSNITKDNFIEYGVPIIRGVNISRGRFFPKDFVYVSEKKADELRASNAFPNDLVFTHRGTLGQVGIIPKGLFKRYVVSQSQMKISFDETKVKPHFMFYYFSSSGKVDLLKHKSGSGVPAISSPLTTLKNLEINLPPLPTQRKIAGVLSAYDDLIENNTRRIAILEEMAQRIYKEWFVDFKYPDHENDELIDSELGMIPEVWEVSIVNDICEFVSRGVTPKYEAGSKRFIINQKANRGPILDMNNLKELTKELVVPPEKHANYGDLLINCLGEGTIGRVHYFSGKDKKYAVDQHMSICRSRNLSICLYLYFHFESPIGQYNIHSLKTGGTNMTMFNISTLRSYQVVVPAAIILSKFYDLIFPLISLKQKLIEKSQTLRQTRDLLLPKLISGKVDVSELNINIGEA